jgi:hypothetical protein
MKNRIRTISLLVLVAVVAAACSTVNAAEESSAVTTAEPIASPAQSPAAPGSDQDARDYCLAQGGQLVDRVATSNTNGDPSTWLTLGGRMTFCEFEEGSGDNATRISVDLTTLYSTSPTLAGVAYLSRLPVVTPPQPGANPADYNCTKGLGGTVSWGNSDIAGGWVDPTQPVFSVMDECVFPDFSAVDAFGIFYYANGAIRGADLATKMRYRPDERGLPQVFTPKTGGNRP